METILWLLYAADVVASLRFISGFAACIATTVVVGTAFPIFIEDMDKAKPAWRACRTWAIRLCIAASVVHLLPSQRLLYIAVGYKAGVEVMESRLGKKTIDLVDAALDRALAEVKEKSK